MVIKIGLTNSDKTVLVDHHVYEELCLVPYFREHQVLERLREHSTGVPVFQKFVQLTNGRNKVESIYLNSYIANKYIGKPSTSKRMFITYLNGNKMDCRLKNMRWDSMVKLSRDREHHHNKTGFRGVRRTPDGKFVSMISDSVKQIYLGTFHTPEEAALAYNRKSMELFGKTKSLNKVDETGKPIPTLSSLSKSGRREKRNGGKQIALSEFNAEVKRHRQAG